MPYSFCEDHFRPCEAMFAQEAGYFDMGHAEVTVYGADMPVRRAG